MKRIELIKSSDSGEEVINLTPVEEFVSVLEKALGTEENLKNRKSVELTTYFLKTARNMDEKQLRFLTSKLVCMVERWAFLYQSTLEDPEAHLRFVQDYRKLQKKMEEAMPDYKEFLKMIEEVQKISG